MPLYLADWEVPLIIREIKGTDKIKRHLNNLGFTAGETVEIMNSVNNNLIVKVKGVKMALSEELAKRIFV